MTRDGYHAFVKFHTNAHRLKRKVVSGLTSIILLFVFPQSHMVVGQEKESREINTMSDLEMMMKSSSWEDRMFAAQNLLFMSQIDTMKAVEILVDAIVLESAQSSSLEFPPRSYLNNSERILRKLIFDLVDLGPSIIDDLYIYADNLSGEPRAWVLIALGLQEEPSVHIEIRKILLENPDPNLRSMAARALYEYADTLDIPSLKEALTDDYKLTINSCTPTSGDLYEVVYPVRQEAASTLRKMGFYVLLEGAKTFLKEPGEWDNDYPEKPE